MGNKRVQVTRLDRIQNASTNWNTRYRQKNGYVSKEFYDTIVKDAVEEYLDGFGIDWNQYNNPEITFADDDNTCEIEWTHKESEQILQLSHVWFDDDGKILQAGTNYGQLTL